MRKPKVIKFFKNAAELEINIRHPNREFHSKFMYRVPPRHNHKKLEAMFREQHARALN